MIPGFEDQLVDKKINSDFEIKTNFPDDYFKKDLAGNEAVFKIHLNEVQENVPSKIDKDLFEKLAMEVKNENEFRNEIKKRMENESVTQEKTLSKDSMYELLLKINKFSAPKCTINEQSELMRKEALSRIGRNPEEESDNDLFPLDTFKENAEKRVKLDLLFTALLNHYDLKVNQDELKEFIEEEAKKYKDPKQFETWVYNQPNQLDQYRMIVLENKLVEKLDNDLKSKDKVINFKDLSKY
jgi:trigger factor